LIGGLGGSQLLRLTEQRPLVLPQKTRPAVIIGERCEVFIHIIQILNKETWFAAVCRYYTFNISSSLVIIIASLCIMASQTVREVLVYFTSDNGSTGKITSVNHKFCSIFT
jgi:hypothetical protein